MQDLHDRFIQAETQLKYIDEKIDNACDKELPKYTKLSRFMPVERIVYGAISIVLVGVVTALLSLVLKK